MAEKKALQFMEIRTYSNLELANIALGSLEELVRRGNEELDEARQRVSFFHSDTLYLQHRATLMNHDLELTDSLDGDPNWDEEMEHTR